VAKEESGLGSANIWHRSINLALKESGGVNNERRGGGRNENESLSARQHKASVGVENHQ
jgi:hypothetical protein